MTSQLAKNVHHHTIDGDIRVEIASVVQLFLPFNLYSDLHEIIYFDAEREGINSSNKSIA
jgi:hypothetical protein